MRLCLRAMRRPAPRNVSLHCVLVVRGKAHSVFLFTCTAIFRWLRGELIGKSTYGKVYPAFNATTGEIIAVKQVEMPQTASNNNDQRQISAGEALKLESETLKDLDHPNIVQYIGFEETPQFLSVCVDLGLGL